MTFRFSYHLFFFSFSLPLPMVRRGRLLSLSMISSCCSKFLGIPRSGIIFPYVLAFVHFFACFFGLLSQCVQLFELFVCVRGIPNRTIAGVFGFFSFLFLTFSLHTLMLFVGWLLMMEEEDGGRRILGNELKEDARWSRRL